MDGEGKGGEHIHRWLEWGENSHSVHRCCTGYGQADVDKPSSRAFDLARESLYKVIHLTVLLHELGYLVDCVKHCGVIAATDSLADFGKAGVGQFAREIHGDLPGKGDVARPLFAL